MGIRGTRKDKVTYIEVSIIIRGLESQSLKENLEDTLSFTHSQLQILIPILH